jgi:hypothetical protein
MIGQARPAADTAVAFASDTTEYADRPFGAASITMPPIQRWRHIGRIPIVHSLLLRFGGDGRRAV